MLKKYSSRFLARDGSICGWFHHYKIQALKENLKKLDKKFGQRVVNARASGQIQQANLFKSPEQHLEYPNWFKHALVDLA